MPSKICAWPNSRCETSCPPIYTICFLCQSAAEKFLKGYLISLGWTLEKTHDIVALLELCTEYDPGWGTVAAADVVLNEYIVAGRYPGDIAFEDIGQTEAEEALKAAQHIRARVADLASRQDS